MKILPSPSTDIVAGYEILCSGNIPQQEPENNNCAFHRKVLRFLAFAPW
jgi:hypothetical protein